MTRAVLAAAGVLLTLAATAPRAQQPAPAAVPDRGMLAVVRRDGLLVPFAAFRGSDWIAPWPSGTRAIELPATLEAVPDRWWAGGGLRKDWVVHLPDGTTKPVSVSTPHIYRSFCTNRIGLVSDYQSSEPLPLLPPHPFPKDGLALSPDVPLQPIEHVSPSSPQVPGLLERIGRDLDKAESKTVSLIRMNTGWHHPESDQQRVRRPVTLEAWYRSSIAGQPGWTVSYFEAVRSYPAGPSDEGCGLVTFFSGWVHQNLEDPSKNRSLIVARVTYCDRHGVTYMLPFGRMIVGGKEHWVYQLSGFDQEWYEVARIMPPRVTFEVAILGGRGDDCR